MLTLGTKTRGVIRDANIDELLRLAWIRRMSWWETYRGIIPESELAGMNDRRTAHRMYNALRSGTGHSILVLRDRHGTPFGYAWAGPQKDRRLGYRGEIYELYLHPICVRQGAGRRLLNAAIWRLVEQRLHPILVWVLADNSARHFYAACGGQQVLAGPVQVGGRWLTRLGFAWDDVLPLPL